MENSSENQDISEVSISKIDTVQFYKKYFL